MFEALAQEIMRLQANINGLAAMKGIKRSERDSNGIITAVGAGGHVPSDAEIEAQRVWQREQDLGRSLQTWN